MSALMEGKLSTEENIKTLKQAMSPQAKKNFLFRIDATILSVLMVSNTVCAVSFDESQIKEQVY